MHNNFWYPSMSERLNSYPFNFSALWDEKIFNRKIGNTFFYLTFFDNRINLKYWRVCHESIRHCETKFLDWKTGCPPSLIRKFFHQTGKFLEHRREPLRSFSVLWNKKIRQNYNASPLLCIKTFVARIFLKQKGFPCDFFGTVRQENFDKDVIAVISNRNFDSRTFLKDKGPATKFFGTLR